MPPGRLVRFFDISRCGSKCNWGKQGQGLQLEVWVEAIGILPDGRLWPELSTAQTKDLQKWPGDSHEESGVVTRRGGTP